MSGKRILIACRRRTGVQVIHLARRRRISRWSAWRLPAGPHLLRRLRRWRRRVRVRRPVGEGDLQPQKQRACFAARGWCGKGGSRMKGQGSGRRGSRPGPLWPPLARTAALFSGPAAHLVAATANRAEMVRLGGVGGSCMGGSAVVEEDGRRCGDPGRSGRRAGRPGSVRCTCSWHPL
jgi:hypothetical protein